MRQASESFALWPCAALVAGLLLPGAAGAQQPARPPATAPAPNPILEEAQKAFEALPESERKAIQNDLIWGSDFTATISGSFGRRTFDAIMHFQTAAKLLPDGILDAPGRKLLADVAARARTAARFTPVVDAKTGASIGVPAAALSKREVTATGTRWSTPKNDVVLETAVAAGGAAELPAAFERVVGLAAPGRKVTYKLLRPDFFVVAGEVGARSFYTRYGVGPTSLRGYTLAYPTSQQKALERYVIAIANSYDPSPGAPVAAAPTAPAGAAPAPGALQPPAAENWPAGLFQTGLVVAPGKIVTAARATVCPELLVNRRPARIAATDRDAGLVVLEGDTGNARPLALRAAAALSADSAPVILGFGIAATPVFNIWSGTVVTAEANAPLRLAAPLPREAGGAIVVDRTGGLVGLIAAPDGKLRVVAGFVPAVSHRIVPAQRIAAAAGTSLAPATAGQNLTAGTLAAALRTSVVAVDCGRPMPRN